MTQELLVIDDNTKIEFSVGTINIQNLDGFKEGLKREIGKYDNLVVSYTDKKTIKEAKDIKAKINKIAKQIDEYRKDVKKTFTKPLNDFENEMNDIKSIATVGANKIGVMLDEVEEQRKTERQKEVLQMIDALCSGYSVGIKPQWLNATKKDTDIRAEILEIVEQEKEKQKQYDDNVKIIKSFAETYRQQPDGWVAQLQHVPVQQIIENMKVSHNAEVEKQRQFEALQQKNKEVLSEVENAEIVSETENKKTPEEQFGDFIFSEWYGDEETEKTDDVKVVQTYVITASDTQFKQLQEFMSKSNIEYELLEKEDDTPASEVMTYDNEFPW